MTTTVIIKHDGPDHHDILVESINPKDGKTWSSSRRVKVKEEVTFYVHDSAAIRVTELAKVADEVKVG